MVLEWLLYAATCSAVIGMGGLAAERTLQLFALPQRWAWAGAILASLVLPLALPRMAALGAPETTVAATLPIMPAAPIASMAIVDPVDGPRPAERVALGAWLLASGVLAGWLALSGMSLRRARRQWYPRAVDGTPVLISRDVGPAVVGWLRGDVVLPAWVLEWDEPRRRLVVAHEREHLRARDPLLLLGGWLSLALAPWSLPLWWQVRRLRLAVEVDCDRRVLRDAQDVRAYGTLLLEVGRRAERGWIPAAAFSEPRRTLERRLRMITWKRPRNRGRHAAAALAATALVPAALFALPAVETPSLEPLGDLLARRATVQAHAVLWITAGDEFRIGRADAPVVREDRLDEALGSMRTGEPGSSTLIVRSDSARVAAPGMGYSAIMVGNAACRAGFATVLYELVKQVPGSAELRLLGTSERRLAQPCDGSGTADTIRSEAAAESAGGATDQRLIDPTRQVVERLRFRPGELAGEAVRTRVHVPIPWTPAVVPTAADPTAAGTPVPAATSVTGDGQAPRLRIRGYNVPAVRPAMNDTARGFPRGAASATPPPRGADGVAGQITGTVRSAGGAPIAGAAVSIDAAETGAITDAAGRFTLRGIPAGTHDIVAARVGYLASTERVTVVTGQSATVDFTLGVAAVELEGVVAVGYGAARRRDVEVAAPAARATIAGSVLDANGRAVVGASVVVPALSIGGITSEQGAFALRVPVGRHEVHVLAPGALQAVVRAVSVPRASEPVSLEVRIPPR